MRSAAASTPPVCAVASTSRVACRFLDLAAFRHLARGLTFNVDRCAEVVEDVLAALNERTGYIEQLEVWNAAGGIAGGPCPSFPSGRVIVDIQEFASAAGKHGYVAAVLNVKERETAPAVFLSMWSPSLQIPMRVELPLRALLKGNPPVKGTQTLYLHVLLSNTGDEFVYYGITKRGWNLRFSEHTRAAVAKRSKRLLARTLKDLIEARAATIAGKGDGRTELQWLITAICGVGLTKEQALEAEEALVEKYSLVSKHANGLNMIPGGSAGIRHARLFGRKN